MQGRLIICLSLFATLLIATGFRGAGTGGSISLHFSKAPLDTVLQAIEQQTDYRFIYTDEAAAAARPISIELKDADIKQVLDACVKGQPLTYSMDENFIVLRLL